MPRIGLLLLSILAVPFPASSQQPFNTDDTDVTSAKTWHFEFANEYDLLQKSLYPNLRQNTANFKLVYGIHEGIEVGVDNQLIAIFNAPSLHLPQLAFGFGDLDFSFKYNLFKENEHSRLPSMAVNASVEVPTGDSRRQLGSGLADYYLYGALQKSLTEKVKLRTNAGFIFAGNTLTGVIGIKTRGTVYTGGASLVREMSPRLKLGGEITGAAPSNFHLPRGQLQTQFGGNYQVRKELSLDFGVIAGAFRGSPRVGAQLGFSLNF